MKSSTSKVDLGARRKVLRSAISGVGIALFGCAATGISRTAGSAAVNHDEPEVTPGEDLMQEHGVIERVLLVYDEAAARIDTAQQLDMSVLTKAGNIIRRFVEEYHEKLEERFVFPRLQAARRETDLVATLLAQHQRGREVTEEIIRRSNSLPSPELAQLLRHFARMYRPHAAREDTVLFPAFRDVVGRGAYAELGEQFETKEHELLGQRGFEGTVGEVAALETALGINDLSRFTAP